MQDHEGYWQGPAVLREQVCRRGGLGMSKDPFGNKKQITLFLPAELKAKLEQEAERKGMQVNEVLSIILYDYFFESVEPE